MTASNVIRLDEIRAAKRARPRLAPADIASSLAKCDTLLYIGITAEGEMQYGTCNVQCGDAIDMMEAAGYLIGELSKIIGEAAGELL
jgi:hypothetical protein